MKSSVIEKPLSWSRKFRNALGVQDAIVGRAVVLFFVRHGVL